MLSREDRHSVREAIESRLLDYFDCGDDFWSANWPAGGAGAGDDCGLDPVAATDWLMRAVEEHRSILHG